MGEFPSPKTVLLNSDGQHVITKEDVLGYYSEASYFWRKNDSGVALPGDILTEDTDFIFYAF